ncbi:MAG: hypothetical protein FWD56_08015 [Bacteroidales bacterium]|nr:hypothetical protein [Bacteroidales bacterium]
MLVVELAAKLDKKYSLSFYRVDTVPEAILRLRNKKRGMELVEGYIDAIYVPKKKKRGQICLIITV